VTAIDLEPRHLAIVRNILERHAPRYEVRAFGSRVAGTARRLSDLDLAVMTERPLSWSELADLRDAFTESDLPMKVDLIDWATASDEFRRIVEQRFEVVQAVAREPMPASRG